MVAFTNAFIAEEIFIPIESHILSNVVLSLLSIFAYIVVIYITSYYNVVYITTLSIFLFINLLNNNPSPDAEGAQQSHEVRPTGG